MTKWYENDARLFHKETDDLVISQLLMILEVIPASTSLNNHVVLKRETAVAHGTFRLEVPGLSRHHDYRIALILQDHYKKR